MAESVPIIVPDGVSIPPDSDASAKSEGTGEGNADKPPNRHLLEDKEGQFATLGISGLKINQRCSEKFDTPDRSLLIVAKPASDGRTCEEIDDQQASTVELAETCELRRAVKSDSVSDCNRFDQLNAVGDLKFEDVSPVELCHLHNEEEWNKSGSYVTCFSQCLFTGPSSSSSSRSITCRTNNDKSGNVTSPKKQNYKEQKALVVHKRIDTDNLIGEINDLELCVSNSVNYQRLSVTSSKVTKSIIEKKIDYVKIKFRRKSADEIFHMKGAKNNEPNPRRRRKSSDVEQLSRNTTIQLLKPEAIFDRSVNCEKLGGVIEQAEARFPETGLGFCSIQNNENRWKIKGSVAKLPDADHALQLGQKKITFFTPNDKSFSAPVVEAAFTNTDIYDRSASIKEEGPLNDDLSAGVEFHDASRVVGPSDLKSSKQLINTENAATFLPKQRLLLLDYSSSESEESVNLSETPDAANVSISFSNEPTLGADKNNAASCKIENVPSANHSFITDTALKSSYEEYKDLELAILQKHLSQDEVASTEHSEEWSHDNEAQQISNKNIVCEVEVSKKDLMQNTSDTNCSATKFLTAARALLGKLEHAEKIKSSDSTRKLYNDDDSSYQEGYGRRSNWGSSINRVDSHGPELEPNAVFLSNRSGTHSPQEVATTEQDGCSSAQISGKQTGSGLTRDQLYDDGTVISDNQTNHNYACSTRASGMSADISVSSLPIANTTLSAPELHCRCPAQVPTLLKCVETLEAAVPQTSSATNMSTVVNTDCSFCAHIPYLTQNLHPTEKPINMTYTSSESSATSSPGPESTLSPTFLSSLQALTGESSIPSIQIDCYKEPQQLPGFTKSILQLPDGGLLVPFDHPDPVVDEKDLEIFHLRRELVDALERSNRHENFLTYERWAHEDTKRRLVEQLQLVKWFKHEVNEMVKKTVSVNRGRKRLREEQRKSVFSSQHFVAGDGPVSYTEDYNISEKVRQYDLTSKNLDDTECGGAFEERTRPVTLAQVPNQRSLIGKEKACTVCGRIFATGNDMSSHRARVHPNWRQCVVCKKTLKNAAELADHMKGACGNNKMSGDGKKIICKICKACFASFKELTLHNKNVHGFITNVSYVCPICRCCLKTVKLLKDHCQKCHESQRAIWLPQIKSRAVRRRSKQILPIDHSTESGDVTTRDSKNLPSDFDCLTAGSALTIEHSTIEVKTELSEDTPSVDNSADGGENYVVIKEENAAEGEVQDEYNHDFDSPCHYCNTNYSARTIRVGSIQCDIVMRRTLQCHFCGDFQKSRLSLTYHMKSHRIKSHICTVCSKRFSTKQALNKHTRAEHLNDKSINTKMQELDSSQLEKERIECICCMRIFDSEQALNIHYAHYAKRKLNQCKFCATRFVTSLELGQHETEHQSEERPYKCRLCTGQTFKKASGLQWHRKANHPDWSCVDFYFPEMSQELAMANYDRENEGVANGVDEMRAKNPEKVANESVDSKARKSLVTIARSASRASERNSEDSTEECHYCYDRFKDKLELSVHLQLHKIENEPFKCPECLQTFAWKNDRSRHRFTYHGVPLPEAINSKKQKSQSQTSPVETMPSDGTINEEAEISAEAPVWQDLVKTASNKWRCNTCGKFFKNYVSGNIHAVKCRKNALARMYQRQSKLSVKDSTNEASQQVSALGMEHSHTDDNNEFPDQAHLKVKEEKFAAEFEKFAAEYAVGNKDTGKTAGEKPTTDKLTEDSQIFKNLLNRDLTNLKARFELKPIQCSCCHRVFKNGFTLSRHVSYMIAHWCRICQGLYKKLALHQESRHGQQYKAVMCLQCGSVFETQSGLNEHIVEEHAKLGLGTRVSATAKLERGTLIQASTSTVTVIPDSAGEHTLNEQTEVSSKDSNVLLNTLGQYDENNSDTNVSSPHFVKGPGERSVHDLFNDSQISTISSYLFSKKVANCSNFLLSTCDPSSRAKEVVAPRLSRKNASRPKRGRGGKATRSPGRQTLLDNSLTGVCEKESDSNHERKYLRSFSSISHSSEFNEDSAETKQSADSGNSETVNKIKDEENSASSDDGISVDSVYLSDECTSDDRGKLEAALEAQYSRAVQEYERILAIENLTEDNEKGNPKPKQVKTMEEMDHKNFRRGRSELQNSPVSLPDLVNCDKEKEPKKKKKKMKKERKDSSCKKKMRITVFDSSDDDDDDVSTARSVGNSKKFVKDKNSDDCKRKFKIPKRSPSKRTKKSASPKFDEIKKAKRMKMNDAEPNMSGSVMDKLKKKLDPKTLSLWANLGKSSITTLAKQDCKEVDEKNDLATPNLKDLAPTKAVENRLCDQQVLRLLSGEKRSEAVHLTKDTRQSVVPERRKLMETIIVAEEKNSSERPRAEPSRKARKTIHGHRYVHTISNETTEHSNSSRDVCEKPSTKELSTNKKPDAGIASRTLLEKEPIRSANKRTYSAMECNPSASVGITNKGEGNIEHVPSTRSRMPSTSERVSSRPTSGRFSSDVVHIPNEGWRTPSEGGRTPSEGGRTPSEEGRTPNESERSFGTNRRTLSDVRRDASGETGTTHNTRGDGSNNSFNCSRARKSSHGFAGRYDGAHETRRHDDRRSESSDHHSDKRADQGYQGDSQPDYGRHRFSRTDGTNRDTVADRRPILDPPPKRLIPEIAPRSTRDEYGRPLPISSKSLSSASSSSATRIDDERASSILDKRVCRICSKYFPTRTQLLQHVFDVHKKKDRISDSNVSRFDERSGRLSKSSSRSYDEDDFSHRNSNRDISDDSPLIRHARLDEGHSSRHDRYDNPSSRDHADHFSHSPEEQNIHKCRFCNASFPDRVSRSHHIVIEHCVRNEAEHISSRAVESSGYSTVPQYTCTDCWKEFVSDRGLELHMANKHGVAPNKRPKIYSSQNEYDYNETRDSHEHRPRARMGGHSFRPDNRPRTETKCEACGKVCVDMITLQDHMRIHDTKWAKKTLLPDPDPRMNIGPPAPGTVTCKICLSHFSTFSALREHHTQLHSRNPPSSERSSPFTCRHCGKIFRSPGALNAHKAVHRSLL